MKNMRRLKRARRASGECSMANVLSWSIKHLVKGMKTRLTYNCAHLRSTKESLTIFWVKIF